MLAGPQQGSGEQICHPSATQSFRFKPLHCTSDCLQSFSTSVRVLFFLLLFFPHISDEKQNDTNSMKIKLLFLNMVDLVVAFFPTCVQEIAAHLDLRHKNRNPSTTRL